jgi:hypothetical protein
MPRSPDVRGFVSRWRKAAARLVLPATVLVGVWILNEMPFSLHNLRTRSALAIALEIAWGPVTSALLLVASMALVEATSLRGRVRTLAMVAAAIASAALPLVTGILIMIGTGLWPNPLWSSAVMMWANFGRAAMICVGAVMMEDYRTRSILRAATLRDMRLRAADVVRRTAEVRVQAARARVDPRFLFDALSAVERVHDADTATGNRLLDDLVTYLRGVVPDLRGTPDPGSEAEIARVRLAIERAILRGTENEAVENPP